jgi:ferritin
MSLSPDLEDAFNAQIQRELSSAYGYLAKVAYFDHRNLTGFAHWMHVQYEEEISHAMRFYRFVLERGTRVELRQLPAPRGDFDSVEGALEDALAGEQNLSRQIDVLYEQAAAAKDYASFPLLQWFIEEQVEEEALVGSVLAQVQMIGDNKSALLILDRELAHRSREGG